MSDPLTAALRELVREEVTRQLSEHGLQTMNGSHAESSPWLSVAEAAVYVRISERKLQRLIAAGSVRSTTVGRRRLLHRDELDALVSGGGGGAVRTVPPRRRGV